MSCEFDWTGALVLKTFSGFVSGNDFVGSAETVSADPRFDDLRFIVNDLRHIAGHSIDAATYLRVAAARVGAARSNPNFRVVFVADALLADELRAAVAPALMSRNFDPWFCSTLGEARSWMAAQPEMNDFRPTGF